MLKAKLIVVGGDAKAGEVNLNLPSTIGRGREASITLPHSLVSRMHCEFFEKEGKLFVKDLESMNGTFINNIRITGEHVIEPQQLITLGNVTFRASYETGVEVEQAELQAACVGTPSPAPNLETELLSPSSESNSSVIEVPGQPAEPDDKVTLLDSKESKALSDNNKIVSVEITDTLSVEVSPIDR